MKKYIITLLLGLTGFYASAQQSDFILTYQMALPLGNTSDYISTFSGRGVGLEWKKHLLTTPVSFGFSVNWNVLYQKVDDRYNSPEEGIVADGKQYRYHNTVPILLHANYYFNEDGIVNPFVGVGLGTYYINQRTSFGQWAFIEQNWHFGVAPEVGVVADVSSSFNMLFTIRYNHAFKAGNATDHSYLGFNVGFVF
ncbi:outer membrane beta-barrel protein [Flammeovirga sp. OC4]|uniref:outer membrane beta-barrel protein n=1 Tax=Flammeovirga sp. OC4 TaxID=1382345 RepID=UPI0005C489FD|nr:outer membrane beta-barrel protein [Flammeovirga sp. OC4]